MGAVAKRRELRAEAKQRQQEVIARLKVALAQARANKRSRVAQCGRTCAKTRKRLQADAVKAREQLRARIARAKAKAQEACRVCRVTANEEGLRAIDKVLGELGEERAAIASLRARASRLRSSRGAAGGRRAAELRAESDDEVRRELPEADTALLALWEREKGRIRPGPRTSRTEAFIEWVESHPEEYALQVQSLEALWEREAAEHYEALRGLTAADLEEAAALEQLRRSEAFLESVPF